MLCIFQSNYLKNVSSAVLLDQTSLRARCLYKNLMHAVLLVLWEFLSESFSQSLVQSAMYTSHPVCVESIFVRLKFVFFI